MIQSRQSSNYAGLNVKILLIATNQADRFMDRMVVRPVPIGLAYLAAAVDESRHQLRVLDLMFSDDGASDVEEAVREFQPDLVGLSIRNLDNQSSLNPVWNLPGVKAIVEKIRDTSGATILCGGPAFSILPSECLEYVGADIGISGDAAAAFATLVDRLESEGDYTDIPGIVYRDGDEVVVSEGKFTSSFHHAPRLDMLNMRKYNGSGFGVGVVTKLAQAYYPTAAGRSDASDWRIRPPEDVIDEIRALNRGFGINKIFFIDSGFNRPVESAKSLCRAIIDSGLKIRWNTYVRPGEGDAELAQLMKESGCSMALLAESGGDADGLIDRLSGLEMMANLFRDVALPFAINIRFGEPGEREETVDTKLDFLRKIEPAFAALRVGTRILPGAEVAQTAIHEGLIDSESALIYPIFYVDKEVSPWLVDRLRAEVDRYPRWNLS